MLMKQQDSLFFVPLQVARLLFNGYPNKVSHIEKPAAPDQLTAFLRMWSGTAYCKITNIF